ncbi:DNA internalization-related competence protein ComEC/Rec2 [Caenimonas aquaedulcis]|uniref:DNA internalization-related competence protein ComEC/Rec2 n=1 Tax=Caenimonas aquaedulcis TaxID=2793270 RepID=A0A931H2X0_9BURK|nr:DNA internalization-related competence protein ComEC/Rec2 [Caenimonas aquaedulcis]MBG9387539.1 DNA internalization-related competence protein ComEC/Rec2 [Caenimonas aquaedulcis]
MHAARVRGASGLAAALVGAVVGPALQLQQEVLWPWWAYAGLALAGASLAALRLRWAWLVAFALLAFAACGARSIAFESQALSPALEGRDIAVTGVIGAMPQVNEGGVRFRLEVESAQAAGEAVQVPGAIFLGWYGGAFLDANGAAEQQRQAGPLRAGERWRMTVRLKAPHGNRNPHGFDYELWLWEQGLQATGYVRAGPHDAPARLLADTWRHPVERARQSVRESIYAHIADRKTAGLVAALVVGDQNAIDRADWDVFRATGVAHLMSISGLHITMFAWVASLAVGGLWRRSLRLCLAWPAPHAALAGGIVLATLYSLFSGWGVPAQRTVWMLAAVGLLRLSGARWPWPIVWLLAAAVVINIDPWALMQAGFWLSFVAVGVLFAGDGGPREVSPATRWARLGSTALASLREQWVITLALTPLTLLLFGQVSVVGLLANAVAIPWVTIVVTPLAMGGVAVPVSWDAAAWAVQALGIYLAWLAAFPFAAWSAPAPALWAAVAGVAGGGLLAMRLPLHARLLGVPLLLPALLWQVGRPAAGQFELLAADVGQGNAVVVRTASHTLVYDAGPRYGPESDAGHRVLVPLLRSLDEHVDTVVLSHRDLDHTGGAAAVLAMQPQAALLSSIEDGHELQSLRRAMRCIAGQRWAWDGVDFQVLHPEQADYDVANKSNAMSCVLRVANAGASALLAGDIEQPQEARLVQAGALSPADVLLVPHHGSKTSSSDAFLEAVHPKIALVQAGYRNRFGHPAALVLQRYAKNEVRVVDSPHCGAALWRSASPSRIQCERQVARRYWHHRPAPAPDADS